MHGKLLAPLIALCPILLTQCAPGPAAPGSPASAEPAAKVVPTGTEQALMDAINAERQKAGKPVLPVSSMLSGLAREDSAAAAAAGQFTGNNAAQLRVRSGFGTVTKFQGTLKDRGAPTGKSFVEYWMKDQASEITDDWSKVGVGIAKAADGRLFAVVLLGRAGGGGDLMNPAMGPGGL